MKQLDLYGRFARAIRCKKRRYYTNQWIKCKSSDFYANPERVTSLWYASREGRMPNFKHPTDFNERLMALNLEAYYDESQWPIRIICSDKYEVRKYVANKGYGEILNECYGVYDSFMDIDFNLLPDQFVIKGTSGSGQNYICRNKADMDVAVVGKQFDVWMKQTEPFGLTTGEWHYAKVKPRIIVEKYLSMLGEDVSLIDYKFHCIHNQIYGEYVCYDRVQGTHSVNYDHYDADWNLTDGVLPEFHPKQRFIPKPKRFDEMKEVAVALSEGLEYVRVDLYEIEGKILFGEMTFTPMGNYLPYTHERLVDMELFYKKTMWER